MNDRFNIRYFNKNTKEFEYIKIGAVNFNLFTDWTVYEQGQFCTGLKDKNGKLIYEGDIVEFEHSNGKNAVVYWNNDRVSYYVKGEGIAYNALSFIRNDYFIVIGNLYENKELLKCQK